MAKEQNYWAWLICGVVGILIGALTISVNDGTKFDQSDIDAQVALATKDLVTQTQVDKAVSSAFEEGADSVTCNASEDSSDVVDYTTYLEDAKDAALDELADNYDLGYSASEISFYKTVKEWDVSFDKDGYTVVFESKVRYDDGDERETVQYAFKARWDYDDEEWTVDVKEAE